MKSPAAESWHPGGEPGLCTPGRTRRCGFRLPASQPRTLSHQAPRRGYTFLHPALRPARPGSSRGALPALRSSLQSGGDGVRGGRLLGSPESRCLRPRPTQGPGTQAGPPRTLVHTLWAVGLRVGVGERKAPSRTPPRPQAADPTAPPRAHTPESPTARASGEDPGGNGPAAGGGGRGVGGRVDTAKLPASAPAAARPPRPPQPTCMPGRPDCTGEWAMALSAATSWPGTRGAAQRAGPGPRAALGWRGGLWSPRPPYPGDGLNGGWRAASPYTEPVAGVEGERLRLLLPGFPPLLRRGARVEAGGLGPRTLAAWSRVGAHSPPRPAPARPPRPPPRPGRGPRPALPGGGGGEEEPPGALGRSRASLRAGERAAGRAEIHGVSAGERAQGVVFGTQKRVGLARGVGERRALPPPALPSAPAQALQRPESALGVSPEWPSQGPVPKDPGGCVSSIWAKFPA